MKHILLILLASLFLPACVPALTPIPATTTPTLTLEPTQTPTPAPTSTLTPTPTPSLPPEISANLPDGYQIVDNQVVVNGQAWYEMTPEKNWQTTDWKILEDAPLKVSWEPKKNWNYWDNNGGQIIDIFSWPVATGEAPVEKQLVLNGQEITVLCLPVIIRDMQDQNAHRHVFLPLRYTDSNGQVLLETWFVTGTPENGVEKTTADLLQSVQRGDQLELQMDISFSGGRGVCLSNRCEVEFDLIETQGLNLQDGILNDGDILPVMIIRNHIKHGEYLLYQ